MITLTFPDGSARQYKSGITGSELAASISKSLSKKAVAISLNGVLADMSDPITGDASVKIVTRDAPEALELIRHDTAHVMAEAVQELFSRHAGDHRPQRRGRLLLRLRPRTRASRPTTWRRSKRACARSSTATSPHREVWPRDEAISDFFAHIGEAYKAEIIEAHPRRRADRRLSAGRLERPLPRPAPALDAPRSAKPSS